MTDLTAAFDRSSAADAESAMMEAFPDAEVRQELLRCLLVTIDRVEALAPGAWSVTMRDGGFCLNVGQVEALTCEAVLRWPFPTSDWPFSPGTRAQRTHIEVDQDDDHGTTAPLLRALTQGDLPESVRAASQTDNGDIRIVSEGYKSVALPQHAVQIDARSATAIRFWFGTIAEARERYLSLAVRTPTGKLRKSTPFKRTDSPGLVEYARAICAQPPVESPTPPAEIAPLAVDEVEVEYFEGHPILVQATRYERDAGARRACLAHHGYACSACGFHFGRAYGTVAERYIQVHHLTPLASMGSSSVTNAISDLRPLCANCHAVAHFKSPPYSVEEIKSFLNQEPKHE